MTQILSSTDKGLQLTVEMEPEWVTVGYGHSGPGTPVHAAVAVGYEQEQLPLVKVVVEGLRAQHRSPTIAIFDDTVQICFLTSPVTPQCRDIIGRLPMMSEVLDCLIGFNITSMADVFRTDDAFKVFQRCYERDHQISLVLMEVANVGPSGGNGEPFDILSVNELKAEFQRIF